MKMGVTLLRTALRDLDEATFARAVHGTARALLAQRRALEAGSRSAATRRRPRAGDARDLYTMPDALWDAACRRWPHLHQYPLGECCERAFKRTVLDHLLPPQGAEAGDLLARFLHNCCFEICIDGLRRPGPLATGYDLSKRHRLVSLGAEAALRGRLAEQCGELARAYLNKVRGGAAAGRLDDRRVGDAWESLVGVRPPRPKGRPARDLVNVVAGRAAKHLAPLQRTHHLAPHPRRLLLHDDRYNVSCSFEPFEEYLGRPLREGVKDLLDLGVAVFMSDLYTRREKELGRRIGLLLSVRRPRDWRVAQDQIRRTVGHLGRDDFDVQFLRLQGQSADGRYSVRSDRRCICLFSGGLDSAAGVAWALEQGMKPVLVSHYGQPQLSGIQRALIAELERHFGRPIDHVGFHVGRRKQPGTRVPAKRRALYPLGAPPASVMTQHLRSFLFLAAAAALALETGTRRIYVFENGPVALNPLISEGRVNTRTAHPHVLEGFRRVVERVFGVDLDIGNPFACLTKGEVVGILRKAGLEALVARTNSCWNWFNVPVRAARLGVKGQGIHHDGDCLPCVVRRAAVHAAGVAPELDAPYLVDVFTAYPNLDPERLLAIADLLRFCRTVSALDDAALLRRVPELSVSVPGRDPRQLMAMLRRHAAEVREVFRERGNAEFQRDFKAVM